jgi:hypothetical protein
LKNIDLIGKDDIVIACMDNVIASAVPGGTIGNQIAFSIADRYIMAVNRHSLSLFDVDKETGEFLGICSKFGRKEIIGANVRNSLGSFSVTLRTASEKRVYKTGNMFHGYLQKDNIARLKEFFESDFRNA